MINIYYFLYIITFLAIILFIYKIHSIRLSRLRKEDIGKKIIYTFWEPHEKIPSYLLLCIKTWKKFLPDYEIKILDYKSVKNYLGEILFSEVVCKKMSLPIQVDAIRVALLKKFGGIWMDADTIILNGKFLNEFKDFELIMFGDQKTKTQNIGFIFSANYSYVINEWFKQIINNIRLYKEIMVKIERNNTFKNYWKSVTSWNFLGNGILDNILKNVTDKQFLRLDRNKINALPEINFFKDPKMDSIQKYQQLYFQKRDPQIILNNSKSIIMLHNSWTPSKYKTMSETKFLKQDILLSKLLFKILNK